MGADFSYYSVMTSIMRLYPNQSDDSVIQEQLLGYARRSISSLQDMLDLSKSLTDLHLFKVSVSW